VGGPAQSGRNRWRGATSRRSARLWLAFGLTFVSAIGFAQSAQAAFPGKNGKIAFTTSVKPGDFWIDTIETIEPDGSGRASLLLGRDPTWSSDGASLAYVNGLQIFRANADGSNRVAITSGYGHPSWSPDGAKIAFEDVVCYLVACAYDLYTINTDGTGKAAFPIVRSFSWSVDPTWSPTGEKIAHVNGGTVCDESGSYCNAQIYTIQPDGSGWSRITDDIASDLAPSWSPDGSKLAFASYRDAISEIYTINTDGTGLTRLTDNSVGDFDPAWSPDGRKIAFVSDRDEPDPVNCRNQCNLEIYTMNADGTAVTNLTNTPDVSEGAPDWQPLTNQPPDCSGVAAMPSSLRHHGFQTVTLAGATDPDGDAVTVTITGITQDEPVGRRPDARTGESANQVDVRGQRRPRGDGRVYRIAFTATDGTDECTGVATAEVRRHKKQSAVDSAPPSYDSFGN
jgi:dipeptidyl aminopeptidase/acylaminoacyl peptidase